MGFLFSGNLSFVNLVKKFLYTRMLSFIFLNKKLKVIVQNKDDYLFLKEKYNLRDRVKLISGGSGIDLNKFVNLK